MVGVRLFGGKFSSILLDDENVEGSFDDVVEAMLIMFQLLVGEGWHDVMCKLRVEK